MCNSKNTMSGERSSPVKPTKRLVNTAVNGLVRQPSYKQLPNGKSGIQIPVYGQLDQAKKSGLDQALSTVGRAGVQVIKQRYPYLERNLLSQYTALNTEKYPFARIHKGVFKKRLILARANSTTAQPAKPLPSPNRRLGGWLDQWLKGIKLELAGRLTTQRSIPRKTVANRHVGKMSTTQPGQYAAKNKLGTYTVKAWLN